MPQLQLIVGVHQYPYQWVDTPDSIAEVAYTLHEHPTGWLSSQVVYIRKAHMRVHAKDGRMRK